MYVYGIGQHGHLRYSSTCTVRTCPLLQQMSGQPMQIRSATGRHWQHRRSLSLHHANRLPVRPGCCENAVLAAIPIPFPYPCAGPYHWPG